MMGSGRMGGWITSAGFGGQKLLLCGVPNYLTVTWAVIILRCGHKGYRQERMMLSAELTSFSVLYTVYAILLKVNPPNNNLPTLYYSSRQPYLLRKQKERVSSQH
jgi:hypothetical protein